MPPDEEQRWNLNIRYHRTVLDALPSGARTALDVGCGDGVLTFDLARRGLCAVGLDSDAASVRRAASARRTSTATHFVVGDLLSAPFKPGSFDVVASIAMLHHVDAVAGLRSMRQLVRPGGVLVIVGFARPSSIGDRARAIVGHALKRAMQLRGRYWEHRAPTIWPPPQTSSELATLVDRELPGATFRNALSGRYVAIWERPAR